MYRLSRQLTSSRRRQHPQTGRTVSLPSKFPHKQDSKYLPYLPGISEAIRSDDDDNDDDEEEEYQETKENEKQDGERDAQELVKRKNLVVDKFSTSQAPLRSNLSRQNRTLFGGIGVSHSYQERAIPQRDKAHRSAPFVVQLPSSLPIERTGGKKREQNVDDDESSFVSYLHRLWDVWDLDFEYIGWCVLGVLTTLLTVKTMDIITTKLGYPLAENGLFDMVWLRVPDLVIALLCAIPGIIFKLHADLQVLQNEASLEFLTSVNFSLNWLEEETTGFQRLSFATINEVKLDILSHMNAPLEKKVLQEAINVPPERPVLFCKRSKVGSVLKKSAQNVISTQFAQGHVHRAFHESVRAVEIVLAFTFEKDDRVPQRKIRVMLCPVDLLSRILQDPSPPLFKRPAHEPRWDTLLEIARLYKEKSYALAHVTLYSARPSLATSGMHPSIL
eukprot:m.112315 g.112315  ORF g.112315 m.112315 type:complete len:446 (+) comp9252_c0_seq5:115-1452(+)